jgi:hypothetical protein
VNYNDPVECWDKFWKRICANPDGSINLIQIKKELFDFYILLVNSSKVYDSITGGRISKPLTDPDAVIQECEDYYRRHYEEVYRDEHPK